MRVKEHRMIFVNYFGQSPMLSIMLERSAVNNETYLPA